MTKEFYKLTILNSNDMLAKSLVINSELTTLLMGIEREKRFSVLAYQQKETLNKIYIIPSEAFRIKPDLLSNYELVSFSGSADFLAQDSIDGLYDPIMFAM